MSKSKKRKSNLTPQPSNLSKIAVQKIEQFQGPLPRPADLEAYGQILPSAPERIIQMAEKQQSHLHGMIEKQVATNTKLESRGQIFTFILILAFFGLAVFALYFDRIWFALGSGIQPVIFAIAYAIYNIRKK